MRQEPNFLQLRTITYLTWLLYVTSVVCQNPPVPQIKVLGGNDYFQAAEDASLGFILGKLEVINGLGLSIESKSHSANVTVVSNETNKLVVNVKLAQNLDYDGELKQAKLIFQYGNANYQGLIFQVILYVINVNDEVPVFQNQPYLITVPENTPVGTIVGTNIKATDRDENDNEILNYILQANGPDVDQDYKTKFKMSPDDAHITLNGILDYETNKFYQYTVIVMDTVHNTSTDVFIKVSDIQDTPPEFVGAPFHAIVEENSNSSTALLTVKAEDGDRGAPNSITYRIVTGSETCPGLFQIDANSGEMTSKSVLDRDDGDVLNNSGVCSLTIEAVEGSEHPQGSNTSRSTAETIVTITITDVDDNNPLFSASNFSATLDENTQQGVPITTNIPILVNDKDQGNNATFEVKVKKYPHIFDASPSIGQSFSDILIRVKDSSYLDYEQRQYIYIELEAIPINAAPYTKGSTAGIELKLKNINDNRPVFSKFSTSVSVEEGKQNFQIMIIQASDADVNDGGQNFGTVTYSLDGSDPNFELNDTTGELKVKANASLDRETKDLYYLTVIAEDGGHIKVTTQLNIKITDVNDCLPSFVTDDYQTSLQESSTSFSRILKVHATDNDEQGKPNSDIVYSISSSKPSGLQSFFSIDQVSGALKVLRALDYENITFPQGEEGKINLTIMATDKGSPPLNTTVDAIVVLQDANDNYPTCKDILAEVSENETKSSVLVSVEARDDDGTAPNKLIIYSIDHQNAEKFIMDSNSGRISLRSVLDREIKDYYDITVTVNDLGLPSLPGYCHVTINVTDINDTPPSFNMMPKEVNITENGSVKFVPITAKDADLDYKLKFGIDWGKSTATDFNGLQLAKGWIKINQLNHSIEVQSLDRESMTHFTLALTVEDENSQNGPQKDTTFLTVIVEDENDNAPTFSSSSYHANIPENMPEESEIHTNYSLTVQDKDEGANSEFSVSLINYKESFTIKPLKGIGTENFIISIQNSSILDFETVQVLELKLLTIETKTKQKFSGTTTVTLSLINKNDNIPNFIGAPFTGNISENEIFGTSVITVTAHDDDKEPYGVLYYSFQSESAQFAINRTTGVVSTKLELNREIQSSYTLTVHVEDAGHFGTMTQLTITVEDINDEEPIFTQTVYNTNIPENQLSFNPPFIVQAFDKDEANTKNSEISYSIHSTAPSLPSKFNISTVSGEITLRSALDFEALDQTLHGSILVVVVAEDNSAPFHSTTVTATINVIDVNDEVPMFESSEYTVQQPENIKAGTSIFSQSAYDNDTSSENNRISYSIDTLSASIFSCDENSGVIKLKTSLDHEMTDHYDIIVTVRDHGFPVLTSTTVIHVNVTDINDERPQFKEKQMSTNLTENSDFSFNCSAFDKDRNHSLYYSINWLKSSGQMSDGKTVNNNELKTWMEIRNPSDCQLVSVKPFNREAVAKFTIILQVKDIYGTVNLPQIDTAILVVDVSDENDFSPTFHVNGSYKAEIRENMPQGSDVRFLSPIIFEVFDLDSWGNNSEFQLVLLDHDKMFKIGPNEGISQQVFTLSVLDPTDLDYEKMENITLKVMAKEINTKEKFNTTATITVDIINVNDNIPEFEQSPYTAHISENSISYKNFITLKATDLDQGFYGSLTYSLKDESKKFAINGTSGEVYTLTSDLDRETTSSYTVTVTAKDGGNFTASTQLTIIVDDENDQHPVFSFTSYQVEIEEKKAKFEPGFFVHATDADETNTANSRIKYKFINALGPPQSNFTINETTGEVYLKSALDFEALENGNTIILSVQAQDLGVPLQSSMVNLSVAVVDVNDEIPYFLPSTYSKAINESSFSGSSVIQVQAHDNDKSEKNNQVSYMIDVLSANTFSINDTTGIITVKTQLDRELIQHYNIVVTALDNGQPTQTSTVTVAVSILDVNDSPPHFSRESATIEVTENLNKDIYTLDAKDLDTNPNLKYSILWSASSGVNGAGQFVDGNYLQNYIDTNHTTGAVYAKQNLDREAIQRLQLTLFVEDLNGLPGIQQNDTAMLTVVVKDVNDNPPKFVGASKFVATIQENMPNGSELKFFNISALTIDDPDGVGNNNYTIVLTGSTAFLISPTQGTGKVTCVITVADFNKLDYEKQQNFSLMVSATDSQNTSMSSTINITVQLINENDNIPQFVEAPFIGNITERSKRNTTVTKIYAEDCDLGDFGQVKYSLKDDNKRFAIDEISGLIYSLVSDLDREETLSYTVTVTATDQGNFTAMAQLTIYLLDVDDEPPVFIQPHYNMEISEGSYQFASGFQVHAVDRDEPNTPNSDVRYSLLDGGHFSSNFKINETSGEIGIKTPLDFEAIPGGNISLIVQAQDQGANHLNNTSKITVKVTDINDNHPKFNQTDYKYNISENADVDVTVGKVKATDGDGTSPNNELYYVIQSGGLDKFQMNSSTGEISVGVGAILDREDKEIYNLIVLAIDRGLQAKTSSAIVLVTVTDVNDSPPVFNSSQIEQSYTIHENASTGTIILTLMASDPDSNSDLTFFLHWNSSRAFDDKDRDVDISIVQGWLVVDDKTGVISVNSQLDRETAEQISLRFSVEDINAQLPIPQITTATVVIILSDVNDLAPEILYIGSQQLLSVSEGTKLNTEVATLTATDKDKDQTVTFSLIDSVYFNISKSGKLTVSKQLDREVVEKLNFTIVATDNGRPPLSSNITFSVKVLDINDNDPEFSSNQTSFSVEENSAATTSITKINATDLDEGPNANITFEFKDISPFRIDPITGDIYVTENLDRETKSSYTLTVFATDNPLLEQRRRSSIVIQIDVTDTNDNAPVFGFQNYTTKISETSKQNDLLLILPEIISANDKDVGQNANVTFSLESIDSSSKDFFKIDPRTGQVSVQRTNLRDQPGIYSYVVMATDQGRPPQSTNVSLTVTILDENINSPVFVKKGPLDAIPECARIGLRVYQFNAIDADKEKSTNGLVNYFLVNGTDSPDRALFNIDSSTGWLTVASELDADGIELLKIKVKAVDNGIPQNTAETEFLDIVVKDIDDNPPEFIQEQTKVFSVQEESDNTEIGRVRATDKDRGSIINYVIDDPDNEWRDYFLISTDNKEGVIQVVKSLDHETISSVQLILRAVDSSSISNLEACDNVSPIDNRKSSPLKITINVQDIDDNPPVFKERSLSKGFLSKTEPNNIILNLKEYVTDNDTEVNSVHHFYQLGDLQADKQLSKGWSLQLKADPILVGINGTITTNFKFPEDQYGVLTLRVLVNDSAGNDTLNLKIYVVGDTQVVHMSFFNTEDELRHIQLQVTEQLSEQGYRFVPDDIMPYYDEKGTVDGTKSVLVVHAVEENTGKIIDGASLLSKLDSKDKVNILNRYKIIKSETGDKASRKNVNSPDDRTQYILIGVIIVIAITFIITLYMLIHNIQRFKRKLKAATIDVYGMDPIKFPGLDNDRIKDSNPVFMRDDLIIDESVTDGYSDSYSHTSENSIDKNAMNEENHGIDEQEVTLNLYGADGQHFNDASDLANPMRYLHNMIEGEPEEENYEELVGRRKLARGFPAEIDSDEDNIFSFSTSNFESTEI